MDAKRKDISFVEKLINIGTNPIASLLDLLLKDKSTKKNIIWATDTYQELGEGFSDKEQISSNFLLRHTDIIKPRIQKTQEAQQERTRKKAEVFTPAWLCNQMNNYCDEEWFGRKYVFNVENDDHTWTVREEPIQFPEGRTWREYVDSRRLEITCGEAPYLMSRYDVSTGELIVPTKRRIGQLDRKLRIVNENTEDYDEWVKWAVRAFEASYGYEYQGDNLLIARINSLMTFLDYYEERWDKEPDEKLLKTVTNKIVWNLWQMDGLQDTVPLGKPYEKYYPVSLFDEAYEKPDEELEAVPSKIYDWRRDNSIFFNRMKARKAMGNKLFNFVIGNPPYNEDFENSGDNGKFARPIYNQFMDAAYEIADKVELIHPARFLFNAGSTPKAWNEKVLNDEHFKVLKYEADSTSVFPNTDIKGGVAVTYHDCNVKYKSIGIFTSFPELNSILMKARKISPIFLNTIISGRGIYKLSNKALEEHPEIIKIQSNGHKKDVGAGVFKKLINIVFFYDKPLDNYKYVKFLGLASGKRVYYWSRIDYQDVPDSFYKYKVFIPKANGSGALGEVLSTPLIGEPLIGATETFLSIGSFDTLLIAEHCLKYVQSKFARVMLGILKITQDNTKDKWSFVPLQDFTDQSDIDWSQSIHEIDLQLYKKYGLDEREIDFIESHVKEMV
jgi:type II restriction enzyme